MRGGVGILIQTLHVSVGVGCHVGNQIGLSRGFVRLRAHVWPWARGTE